MAPQPPHPRPPKIQTLWRVSANSYWPRYTRYAGYPILLSIAAAFAQFGLGIYLAGKIYGKSDTVRCLSFAGQEEEEWVEIRRPVVVVDVERVTGMEMWGFGSGVGLGTTIFFTTLFPALTILWTSLLYTFHNRPRPLSPRVALGNAICLLLDWLCYVVVDAALYVDVGARGRKWPLCYVQHEVAGGMWSARRERMRALGARAWIGVVGVVLTSVYLVFVLCAIYLSYKETSRAAAHAAADHRVAGLQNGASPSARPDSGTQLRDLPSAPVPSADVYPPLQAPQSRLQRRPELEVYVPTRSPVDAKSRGREGMVGSAGVKGGTTMTGRLQPVVEDEERDVGVRVEGTEGPFKDPKDGSKDVGGGDLWKDGEVGSKSRT